MTNYLQTNPKSCQSGSRPFQDPCSTFHVISGKFILTGYSAKVKLGTCITREFKTMLKTPNDLETSLLEEGGPKQLTVGEII